MIKKIIKNKGLFKLSDEFESWNLLSTLIYKDESPQLYIDRHKNYLDPFYYDLYNIRVAICGKTGKT